MSVKPLNIKSKLHPAPKSAPLYFTKIKDTSGKEVKLAHPKAVRSLIALMDLAAVNGGAACHWGGPSAMTEVWSALHGIMFKESNWFDHYHFVNDIGHAENGVYAIRTVLGFGDLTLDSLKGFRSIGSKLTGHGESHLYPEGVLLSNGPLGSALPQAQGLAIADKLLGNERITVVSISDGAMMEGEAKEAMAAIPGLVQKGKMNPFVLLLSDNNTKLGGRIDKDSYSMQPSFESLSSLGWKVVKVEDGHHLESVYQVLEEVLQTSKAINKPTCVWIKTVKGHGVKSTVDSSSGGHGFPLKAYDEGIHTFLKEIWGKEKMPAEFKTFADELTVRPKTKEDSKKASEKIQNGVAKALIRAADEGFPVFSISSDLQGSTGVKAFHGEFSDRYLDIGIAEANMVSTAVGMSKAGFIPVVDTFAAFGVTKGNLPLIMGSLSEAPVIAIFSHTGFQDAADGASHQSLNYLSAVSSIPHVHVVNLASSKEAEVYVYEAVRRISRDREEGKSGESFVFFLGRENFSPEVLPDLHYDLFRPQRLKEGEDLAIVTTGSMANHALKAAEELKEIGLSAAVINNSFVNHSDFKMIAQWVSEAGSKIVTVEDHQLIGGMGAQLIHQLKLLGEEFDVVSLGVRGEFGQSAYSADELYSKHKIDSYAIVESSQKLLSRKEGFMKLDPQFLKEMLKDNASQLVSLFQEKLGVSKEEATKRVDEIFCKYRPEDIKERATKTAGFVFGAATTIIDQVKEKIKR